MRHAIYNARGEITQFMEGPEVDIVLSCNFIGLSYVAASEDTTEASHFVQDGTVLAKPINPTTHDGAFLHNLPVPCRLYVQGKPYDVNEAEVELEFPYPGTYSIKVEAFPYLDAHFTIQVP